MITHLIIILYKFSKAISDLHFRHNFACFCSLLPTKIVPNKDHSTVLRLSNGRCLLIELISFLNELVDKNDCDSFHSLTESNALFLNESAV